MSATAALELLGDLSHESRRDDVWPRRLPAPRLSRPPSPPGRSPGAAHEAVASRRSSPRLHPAQSDHAHAGGTDDRLGHQGVAPPRAGDCSRSRPRRLLGDASSRPRDIVGAIAFIHQKGNPEIVLGTRPHSCETLIRIANVPPRMSPLHAAALVAWRFERSAQGRADVRAVARSMTKDRGGRPPLPPRISLPVGLRGGRSEAVGRGRLVGPQRDARRKDRCHVQLGGHRSRIAHDVDMISGVDEALSGAVGARAAICVVGDHAA